MSFDARRARRLTAGVILTAAMGASAAPTAAQQLPGSVEKFAYPSGGSHYLLYTPSDYDPARPSPLVVVLHGCNSNAEERMYGSGMNAVAEQHGFLVLYPDSGDLQGGRL